MCEGGVQGVVTNADLRGVVQAILKCCREPAASYIGHRHAIEARQVVVVSNVNLRMLNDC